MAPAPAVLLSAPWGRWLAGKLGLVALIVLLGWRNWRAHRHRASLDGATADRLARRATLEVALASAVLVATAALTTTAPPDPAGP
jgi:putative copper export protein